MKFLVFLGSVRESTPPRPARLGARVSLACESLLKKVYPEHEVEIIDPLDLNLGDIFKPEFAYSRKQVPADLKQLADKIAEADGYVMVSPEYNHSMSPALAHLLNHFGSSLFSYKPSVIVTYSAGQWGGARAAVSMRTFLSELGCLPVSAMIHVPNAATVFNEEGRTNSKEAQDEWDSYMNRTMAQLVWWAEGAKQQRESLDPNSLIQTFQRDPSQRNAPK
ncbi:putative reductase [Vibrio variabilis]|uniref:Reductase n=1 Tax=Vibrio variabilis TaxID=990271 RepID=A0ABQ0JJG0_9VIBR|nr:putative reductase [Vibrio variabilis]